MNLATDTGVIQINLDVLRVSNFIVVVVVEADRNQMIARQNLGAGTGRISFNFLSDNALPVFIPGYTIPRRRLVTQALGKVKHAHRHQ